MMRRERSVVRNSGRFPFVVVPERVGERVWKFSTRDCEAGCAWLLMRMAGFCLVVVIAAMLASGVLGSIGQPMWSHVLVPIVSFIVVVLVWGLMIDEHLHSTHLQREVLIDLGRSVVVHRALRRLRVLWSEEGGVDEFEFEVRPFRCDVPGVKGGCVSVRRRGSTDARATALALTREIGTAVAYADLVLGTLGVPWRRSEESLTMDGAGVSRFGASDRSVLEVLTVCGRCRYDLSGIESERCPECGERRGFVPRVKKGEEGV
ncbi:MAG: hypothetical protein KF768_12685 [Phycisphaeraceae bacterium]|nr:hypothetical protein [Phycisphaeraceae bacterium]